MDNIPKFLVSLVLIVLCLMVGIALVYTNFCIDQARSYHDQIIKVISSSDFAAAKQQECIDDAQSKGFELNIEESDEGHIYKVDLTYSISVPVFGSWFQKTISGYAIDYFGLGASINSVDDSMTLQAPTVSLADDTLTITFVDNATSYEIYMDGTYVAVTAVATYDLSQLRMAAGNYEVTVIAKADGYNDSAASNSVTYIAE